MTIVNAVALATLALMAGVLLFAAAKMGALVVVALH